jgi:hypothetical protein
MSDNNNKQIYNLDEVSKWAKNGHVAIPALQRGFVWKPRQVELLWDSILRGFPIGSFVFAKSEEFKTQSISKEPTKTEYFLLDGQQRWNAIELGFDNSILNNSSIEMETNKRAVLWLDLCPQVKSTRKYWVKATTLAHPWGYNNNDDCSILSANERRIAVKAYKDSLKISDKLARPLSPLQTWPYKAELPIPLSLLTCASSQVSHESFVECIKSSLETIKSKWAERLLKTENLDKLLLNIYPTVTALINYYIVANVLHSNVIADENEPSAQTSSLEHLFSRLNTLGTPISQYDLFYSAIKAYWGNIKGENDSIALKYMPGARLVILAIRLALTDDNKKEFASQPTISKIRDIATKKQDADFERITKLYEHNNNSDSQLSEIMRQVENWIVYNDDNPNGLPPVLRTSIAMNSPDVYLLLMYFAKRKFNLTSDFCISISTLLHWFCDDHRQCVNLILNKIVNEKDVIIQIKSALLEALQKGYLSRLYSANAIYKDINLESFNEDWTISQYSQKPWWNLYCRMSGNCELLLYAQRKYLHHNFDSYDPAKPDLWEEHNRPWDYDHIIPRNWVDGKWSQWREFCKQWLNNIGNLAAISFEINRSKSDNDAWGEYLNNCDTLFCNEKWQELIANKSFNSNLVKDPEQVKQFARMTINRFVELYNSWFTLVNFLFDPTMINQNCLIDKRMHVYKQIKDALGKEAFLCYWGGREIEFNDDVDYCQPYLILGTLLENKCFICLTCNCDVLEIGIRKHPNAESTDKNYKREIISGLNGYNNVFDHYWYIRRIEKFTDIASDKHKIDDIANELKSLQKSLTM